LQRLHGLKPRIRAPGSGLLFGNWTFLAPAPALEPSKFI